MRLNHPSTASDGLPDAGPAPPDCKRLMNSVGDFLLELMIGKRPPAEDAPPQLLQDSSQPPPLSLELQPAGQALQGRELPRLILEQSKLDRPAEESSAAPDTCADSQSSLPSKKLVVSSKESLFSRVFSVGSQAKEPPRIEFFSQLKDQVEGSLV